MTWEQQEKLVYGLLTLSDVSPLPPGDVLEELFKHPVCLFRVNKARNQMNPKEEHKEERENHSLLYVL